MSLPAWSAAIPSVQEVVSRSVANNQENWRVAPEFTYVAREIVTKGGQRTDRTFRVVMIDGSPYNELIAVDGKPLSPAEQQREQAELERVTAQRKQESAQARRQRIEKYERGRRQDHELLADMIRAFDFTMGGLQIVNGHECYRIDASPNPNYVPTSRETKILKGMRGTLWVDTKTDQWVRVEASVFQPVAFGLFIAKVQPGTEFRLDYAPIEEKIWEPVDFEMKVNSKILHFWSNNSAETDYFSTYQRTRQAQAAIRKRPVALMGVAAEPVRRRDGAHGVPHGPGTEWLLQEYDAAAQIVQAALPQGGDVDYWNPRKLHFCRPDQLNPVHARHIDIGNEQVDDAADSAQ
ncbi:MAG TPA: hypothetical protein VKV17_17600 [Bryobacteraceae bacterium]|nr:hypothetical protein [Bryobacteraceae bacterium]